MFGSRNCTYHLPLLLLLLLIIIIIIISAAAAASERKSAKYRNLSSSHVFYPVAIKRLGVLADEAHEFITEISRRASQCTADPRETTFLHHRISMAIQRFNVVCLSNNFSFSESPL